MINRRDFLGSSLLSATLLSLPGIVTAATANPAPAGLAAPPKVLMDWHSHFVTRAEIRILSARRQAPRIIHSQAGKALLENVTTASAAAGTPATFEVSDIEARLRHLDQNGIAHQLLTHTVALGLMQRFPSMNSAG